MIFYLKYNMESICKRLVQEQLNTTGLKFSLLSMNELAINEAVPENVLGNINNHLAELGIEIVTSKKSMLVQKIKEAIKELIGLEDKLVLSKTSYYLAKTLNHSYRYLSSVFSQITFTTIENYIILQKIERSKEMITSGELTFTEIAWKLNYSSIAHFSSQFKNTTGFTPSLFKHLINQRRKNMMQQIAS